MSDTRPRRRHIVVAGLVCVAALAAAACGGGPAITPRTTVITLPPPQPTDPDSGPVSGVTAAPPSIANILVTANDPDGKWKVVFKKPLVSGLPDGAQTKINDAVTGQVNGYVSAFTSRTDFPAVAQGAAASSLQGNYAIALNTSRVISFRFTQIVIMSGQDSAGTPASLTVEVTTGEKLTLAELFTEPSKALPIIAAKTHADLADRLGADLNWDGKATSLDVFARAWAVNEKGLEFTWPQGEIASHAAGMPTSTVSWADLKPLLKPGTVVAALAG